MTPTLHAEPPNDSHSLKNSLRLITSLIDTTPPVFYDARRPALRSVLSSPAGLRTVGTPPSSATSKQRDKTAPPFPTHDNAVTCSPLTVHAPLDFLDVSPKSRTRAVSLALPRDSYAPGHEGMPIGKLEARDKASSTTQPTKMLRPLARRSNTISPEMGQHNWGSLPPPRPSMQISPPPHELARFTLSPPTGTHVPGEFICESPTSEVRPSPVHAGGIRSALAEPRISQIEVTSTWSMPMTTVDRVGPRLARWEDRLALPKEPSLRRSASMRSGMKDMSTMMGSGHKRNHSDSLLQNTFPSGTPAEQDPLKSKFLAHRLAPNPVSLERRPTTRRSRTPLPYSMNSSPISETKSDSDRRSTLSRQGSLESLRSTLPRRGRSDSVRYIPSHGTATPVEPSSRPLGVWEKVREEAVSTLVNRSRRGSFTSMWQSYRFGGESDIQTTRPGPDDLDRLQELSLEDGYDRQTRVERKIQDEGAIGDDDDEVFIAFDDI